MGCRFFWSCRPGGLLLVLGVLITSTFNAGESIGKGITGAIVSVGSLKALAIWMIARNGPLMFTFNLSGIFENTE